MKHGWPSGTAIAVSFARGVASLDEEGPGHGIDPMARELLPGPIGAALGALAWAAERRPGVLAGVRVLSAGLVEHLELRTRAIDGVVESAVKRGADQVVILGAGLDARAWRMDALAGARVFEVDHPATQRFKRDRVARSHPPLRSEVRFVAVDFEKDSLGDRLAEAGHDVHRASTWIWEGVTPYLAPEATRATLAIVAARSAPGSVVAMTYATPAMASVPARLRPLLGRAFAKIGEPLRGLVTPETMRAWVEEAGLRVVEDTGVRVWAEQAGARLPPRVRIAERLGVAERR